jgi:hypothetical protein
VCVSDKCRLDVLCVLEPYVPDVVATDMIQIMRAFGSDKYREVSLSALVHKLAAPLSSKDADAILDTLCTPTYKSACSRLLSPLIPEEDFFVSQT